MNYALAVLLATGLSVSVTQGQPVKPVVQQPVMLDYYVPEDFSGFVERAEIIVIARVAGARNQPQGRYSGTYYDIEILSTIKGHGKLGEVATVCRAMGDTEYSDRVLRRFEPGFPAFTVGAKYLLFLSPNDPLGCLGPVYGPAGVAAIDDVAGLRPVVPHPVMRRLSGKSEIEVETAIADVTRRRSPPK